MTSNGLPALPDSKRIGKLLMDAREAQERYTQEQVAPLVGATARSIGAWERGERVPPADQFLALLSLYGAGKELLAFVGKWERHVARSASGAAAREG